MDSHKLLALAFAMWAVAAVMMVTDYVSSSHTSSLYTMPTVRPNVMHAQTATMRGAPLRAGLPDIDDVPTAAVQATVGAATVASLAQTAESTSTPGPLSFGALALTFVAIFWAYMKTPPTSPGLALAGNRGVYTAGEEEDLTTMFAKPLQMAAFGRGGANKRATHICVDCGYIYALPTAFAEQPRDYKCPTCNAGKNRFATYDPETGKTGSVGIPLYLIFSVLGSVGFIGGILAVALNR
jgi:rubredoxin